MRVFNFGPFRIALGNIRVPPGQQDNVAVQNAIHRIRQQAMANNAAQIPAQQNLAQDQIAFTQSATPNFLSGLTPGATALHPSDIQSDILRIQQNIIESMRQLNAQHEQLEVIHRLLAELNQIQQTSGAAAATGQELPPIAPLNPPNMSSFAPQAYFARGSVLRQGDAGIPEGLALPEGWTLRPMALAPRTGQEHTTISSPPQSEQSGQGSSSAVAQPRPTQPAAEAEAGPSTSAIATPQAQAASSSTDVTTSAQPSTPSPKRAESSSLESSWSFGNAGEKTEGESSSTAVAGSSAKDQSVTRRTATVEDAEDNGQ
jgi:E3 ubiquitin-protein ligase synoviolin